jgi:hypothetical protein
VTTRVALLIAGAAALLVPDCVMGQAGSPSETQLQMERRQRRPIVRPRPSSEAVAGDVDTATAEAERRQREDETIRELRRPFSRRPDLDSDVKGGIQSQRLNDALRR